MFNPKRITIGVAFIVFILAVTIAVVSSAPNNSFNEIIVSIQKGQTITGAAQILKANGLLRSENFFKIYVALLDKETGIKTGDYLFTEKQSAIKIASRFINGEFGFPLVKITIPEGSNSTDIATIVSTAMPNFSRKDELKKLAVQNEGYLFPETYFWPSDVTPERIIIDMKSQFDKQIESIRPELNSFGKPLGDIMKLASIIEGEAPLTEDRRIISDILWKRLKINMALQVDPPFKYFLNKTSENLTLDDLKIESPYNLYLHTGLPPTPINNPGLATILDTIHPTKTRYWFYLSGKDGQIYYAETFDGHVANKYKYLR